MTKKKIEKGTIYQQLNKFFNVGIGFDDLKKTNFDEPTTIIKGTSPYDIEKKALELQQKKQLQDKFFRTTDRGFQKALQYEAARLPAYIDYEGFEYYPLIATALDLFMEEATTIGDNGKMLNIHSSKERIKHLLEEFFYDIANVNVNLPFWTRNVVKYGDNFILNYGEKGKGITHVKQLVNYEIERYERIQDGKPTVKFKDRMTGDEFNIFEVSHFRLLGDDKMLPYGSCIVESSKVLTTNGYKNIQDVNKGDKIVSFDVKSQKKVDTNVLDVVCNGEKQTYKVSTRHNFIKATDNHRILTHCDKENDFKYKFVSELKINDKLVINPNDDFNEKIKINKSIEIKEHNGRVYDEFLNDLKHVPDYVDEDFAKLFGFLLGDGSINIKRPYMVYFAYGTNEYINKKYINLLEKFSGKDVYLRHNENYSNGIAGAIVNSKTLATILSNMGFMGVSTTKRIPDWVFSCSKEIREAFIEGFSDADGASFIDRWGCERLTVEISNFELLQDFKTLIQSVGWKSGGVNKRKKKNNLYIKGVKVKNISDSYVLNYYKSINKQTNVNDIPNRLSSDFIIEKIIKLELDEILPVYDIHVDNENHNFYANNIVVHNSVLNKVRRVTRQLIMAEDAMLTYRIVRAGEKKVFKIDVGNIDDDDIEDYVYKIATKFKRMPQVNPNSGQIDYRFNILGNDEDYFLPVRSANTQTGIDTLPGACLGLDTRIDLLDGRSLPLKEIIKEYGENKELWSYSINPKSGEIVPGKITWAGVTRKNTDVLKLTLDNGETITCTPDHKFPLKCGYEEEAQNLKEGDSLWSFNKKTKKLKSGNGDYEMIYDHNKNEWVYTHQMVDNYLRGDLLKECVRHHIDFNRFNNNPNNLLRMNARDHFKLHSKYSVVGGNAYKEKYETDVDFKRYVDENLLRGRNKYHNKLKNDSGFSLIIKEKQSKSRKKYLSNLNDEEFQNAIKHLSTPESRKGAVESFKNNPERDNIIERIRRRAVITKNKDSHKALCSNNTKKLWEDDDFRNSVIEKQTIKYSKKLLDLLIEYLNEFDLLDDVLKYRINNENYGWLIEFNKLNKDNKQLKKSTKITRNNIDKMLKYFGYKNFRDFKSKILQYNHKIVKIEWLREKQDTGTLTIDGNEEYHNFHNFALSCGVFTKNSNLDAIQDIEYLRDNLFTGLGIPKPFLSFQDASGGGKNMAQFDIRFTKKINRIQQAMIQELNKMAVIHLYLLGYRDADLGEFTLTLTNPSTQHELLKAELFRERAQTYRDLTSTDSGIAPMSHTQAKRYLFNMTDKEIIEDLKQQKMEMTIKQELQDTPVVIKKSGLFKDIDDRYGEPVEGEPLPGEGGEEGGDELGSLAGGPSPGMGGGIEAAPGPPPVGGEMGGDLGLSETRGIGVKKMNQQEFNEFLDEFIDNISTNDDSMNLKPKQIISEVESKNKEFNSKTKTLINEIDELLKNKKYVTKNQTEKEESSLEEIDNIDDLDLDD